MSGRRDCDEMARSARFGATMHCILCLLLGLWSAQTLAASPVAIEAQASLQHLDTALVVIPDSGLGLRAEDVLDGRHHGSALTFTRLPPNLGYPRGAYWVYLAIDNRTPLTQERLLVLWRGSVHGLSAHLRSVTSSANGNGMIHLSRFDDLSSRHGVLRLQLAPHSQTRIALRVDTHTALSLDFRLVEANTLAAIDRIDYWFFGLLAGIIGAVGIYLLALFFALRERLYLLFACFSFTNLIYLLHTEGYAYILWPHEWRGLGNLVGTFSGTLFALLMIQFVRDYLDLRQRVPAIDRWLLRPVLWLLCSVFVVYTFAPWMGNSIAAFGVIAATVATSVAALRSAMLSPPVWSFLLATLAFFGLGVLYLLKRAGILPDVQALSLVLQLGSAATTIVFAIALMARIRRIVAERQAQQEEAAERLELQVAERTAELRDAKDAAESALAQLRAAQRHLLETEKMASLGQLVAGVAHEVNTPLGIALTAGSHLAERSRRISARLDADALERRELAAYLGEANEACGMIARNLERAAHLVRSFKQVSVDRTSDGRRRFRLHEVVSELTESLKLAWKRRPLSLEVVCPTDIELDSFPGALGQVLTNCIQNALLHAFEPEQSGLMRIVVEAPDPDYIALCFSDDGKGMDPATLARIFDPFFTTRRSQGGTGLGLHITYNLVVQKLGGSIEADSHPGGGLCLRMRLPRVAPGRASEA